jgi:hypothetical protein
MAVTEIKTIDDVIASLRKVWENCQKVKKPVQIKIEVNGNQGGISSAFVDVRTKLI